MFSRRLLRGLSIGALVAVACVVLAACGSSSSSTSSSSSSGSEESASTGGESASGGADVSAAEAMIEPYREGPTAFPVNEPLTKHLAAGEEIAYLQCATPYCALLGEVYGGAAKLMKTGFSIVKASESTESLQNGLSSIQANNPAAVLLAGVNLASLGEALTPLSEAEIPVAATAVMGDEEQGIDANVNSEKAVELAGEILANYAIAEGASEGGVIWFEVPELDFSKYETEGFKAAMEENCAECEVTYAKTPISSIGSSAPALVVSELQSHPNTKVIEFASFEAATGLPAALKAAGIEVKAAGYAPTPGNLEDIKSGGLSATVGLDTAVTAYTQVDAAVRLATGQPLTKAEEEGMPVIQLLEKKDLNYDVSKGWTGYPDFESKFAKIWNGTE